MSGLISTVVSLATRCLCGRGGSMPLQQLLQHLQQRCTLSEPEFLYVLRGCERFLLVPGPGPGAPGAGEVTVVARTSLRICPSYKREQPCCGCRQLHLCKHFVYGTCRFGNGRKPCKFSHDIQSPHNAALLGECTLQELTAEELSVLLLQNDPSLLPEVCVKYNKGSGPHGDCSFQNSCTKLHLCQHFLQDDCMFGPHCRRSHGVGEQSQRILEKRGLSIQNLPSLYRNIRHLANAAAEEPAAAHKDESEVICLHFIRGSCRFDDGCHRVHFHLPYRWQVLDDDTWTDLENMEDVEREYCDPAKTHSELWPLDFQSMTWDLAPVRRLSTISWVTKPDHYTLTTQWLWYYKGDHHMWVEYGQPEQKRPSPSVTSQTLEKKFLSDRTAKVEVKKGQRQYVICFKDMYQRNPKHNTKRRVRRRPRFVSAAEVERLVAARSHMVLPDWIRI
ncbi:protein mono-ADP-ribosyltransferase PARP12b [Cololabis saira]|uniref:protein mono-ADP-ribosyltransferase PARP12b n=1 Tax=Cololabis saira TaxID=129043 RepID=UPI002AD56F8B|nr:protein mono-ADP-ribosyltransferase PARP12b [Cololabis saira]